jgi:serine/threonine-protein kinase
VTPAPTDAEAWRTLATGAPDLDPEATITAAAYAATVSAPPPLSVPAVTLPELPLLAVDRLDGAALGAGAEADFEVIGVLGEGGMGKVLLARQRSLRRQVAIKVVRAELAGGPGVDALLAEAVITGSVEHPGVIPVHVLGRGPSGRPILVMKRIEGVSWQDLARDPHHPLWAVIAPDAGDRLDAHLEILLAVCSTAHFAHASRFVHRDIKLDNVMIGSFGEVYLVDWGIAMRVAAGGEAGRGPRGVVGTPAYMAPEMVRGDLAHIDARTDVYLLGATLHALLTGASRHRGASLHDVLQAAQESAPFAYAPEVPAELAAICNRATAASPADRFASALELRLALASFRRHQGSIGLSDRAAEELAAVPASGDAARVHALLTECRFGFTAALRDWPENPGARAGLVGCLTRMIDHEIAQRDVEGARALLAELQTRGAEGSPAPASEDLARRIATLEADLRAAAAREAELTRLSRDRDLSIGARAQLAVVAILPVVVLGIFIYVLSRGDRPIDAGLLLGAPLVGLTALTVGVALVRRRLQTEISRKAVAMLFLTFASVTFHRVLMVALGAPLAATLAGDLALGAALAAGMALTLIPRLLMVAILFAAGAVAVALRPDLSISIFSTVAVSGLTLLFLAWGRSTRAR